MSIKIVENSFDPWTEIHNYQKQLDSNIQPGAIASFVGKMRDFITDEAEQPMHLDYYPGVTDKQLERVTYLANIKWNTLASLIVHRVGDIYPDDTLVLIVTWSARHFEAFESCRFLTEQLKTTAPFWKKTEISSTQEEVWVPENSSVS